MGTGKPIAYIIHDIDKSFPIDKIGDDKMRNLALIQDYLIKNNVSVSFPIERISLCRLQDNLEFSQWLYNYHAYSKKNAPEENLRKDMFNKFRNQNLKFNSRYSTNFKSKTSEKSIFTHTKNNSKDKLQFDRISAKDTIDQKLQDSRELWSGSESIPAHSAGFSDDFELKENQGTTHSNSFNHSNYISALFETSEKPKNSKIAEKRTLGPKFLENLRKLENERDFYYNKLMQVENYIKTHEVICKDKISGIIYNSDTFEM